MAPREVRTEQLLTLAPHSTLSLALEAPFAEGGIFYVPLRQAEACKALASVMCAFECSGTRIFGFGRRRHCVRYCCSYGVDMR